MKAFISQTTPGFTFRVWAHFVETLKSPFPYYLNDDRKNTLIPAGMSIFLVVFMLVFQPYNPQKVILIGSVTFIVLFANIVLLPRLFPALFEVSNWTVGKYILFTLWQLFVDGIATAIALHVFNFHPEVTLIEKMYKVYSGVFTNGIIPIALATLVLRNQMLQENLRSAVMANRELERIRLLKEDPTHTKSNIVTIYSDTRETLSLPLSELLYVEASDNYSTIYWKNGEGVEKKMLRINLKNMESQLDNYFAIRCHRSFIVNINAIDHVTGNANGYKLGIKDTNFSVPVSRAKGKEVIEKIGQLRNVFELN
ncbi:LytR/AlgR family response regulator transcription factor [Ohtaekwangia koreensis]|uniref:LytTr DNA-binding domain-containing protein n=1 Tax=Ohtaekwangia koreensis TaxID=688867 RepID=A0A1T5KDC6_9BACT|nr:LytTR family DNA-binding domain-containing protein [Ohtaekwangia koreensis]SKC61691.1 LytTr DNA-binding domain-containing protein [Ohtaekwangia koreensis]